MIIEIESCDGSVLLSGKVSSIGQLKYRMKKVLNQVSEKDFISIFSACYGYDIYHYDESIPVDYIIDLDTHCVYKPIH